MVSVEKNPDHLVQEPDYERFSLCSNLLIENPLKFSARFSKTVWPTMMILGQIVKPMPKMVYVEKNLDYPVQEPDYERFSLCSEMCSFKRHARTHARTFSHSLPGTKCMVLTQTQSVCHPSAELAIAQSVTRAFQHQEA